MPSQSHLPSGRPWTLKEQCDHDLAGYTPRWLDRQLQLNARGSSSHTVALVKREMAAGQDAEAKEFAQSVLPTVEAHLKAINMIAASEGVTTRK